MSGKPGARLVVTTEMITNEHGQIEVKSHTTVDGKFIETEILLANNEDHAADVAHRNVDTVIKHVRISGMW